MASEDDEFEIEQTRYKQQSLVYQFDTSCNVKLGLAVSTSQNPAKDLPQDFSRLLCVEDAIESIKRNAKRFFEESETSVNAAYNSVLTDSKSLVNAP